MADPYNEKVMQHFLNPRNVGEIKDADGIGKVGNVICGDIMWVYIKVGKDKKGEETIEEVKFKTLGCAAAIATSSMITELSKGMTLERAMNISKKDIAMALDGLPPIKMHCSNLAAEALHSAILDYFSKKGNKEMIEKYSKKDSSAKNSEVCWKEQIKI